ncbi:PREDICTED: LOW QUALITY PROTEIN: uncharacterized protein LOC100635930 [Amphimedon queenslandica]|uniref:NADPH-dependent FMN reductase-like domain-containing protein n=2 Tax=Amphimedon queenslandica TaxID=400682 RepID=A0AAN0JHB6_AMPQE|nr:PREDICTED: LOW QUALITY PROTEIN: uncharacterized protein LOC100635930 [Amphimedon queenslandica]|eukprot:XP_019856359.1 PREDICTED: LOW QUALITY PROTEIN: uncharacterized protein LOC100635930 [Amphimedon queenslandica]
MASSSGKALKFVLFLGTVRDNNMGSRAASFVMKKLKEKGHDATLLDPEVLGLPLLKKPLHFYEDRTQAPQVLQDTVKVIEAADVYMVITAEYNQCLPPALTNMMDHFPIPAYKYRPSGIVCYSMGSFGGIRAAIQARSLLGELGSPSLGCFVIPQIQNELSEDGTLKGENKERLEKNADKIITELAWLGDAIKSKKDSEGFPKL